MQKLKEYFHENIDEQFEELEKYCKEDNRCDLFVSILMKLFKDKDDPVANALTALLFSLTRIDFRSPITNPYHFEGSWIYNLNSFIGNYFYDDFYFSVRQGGYTNRWLIEAEDYEKDQKLTQNPLILIYASEDNVKFNEEFNKNPAKNRDLKCKSSGRIEKLLKSGD